MKIYFDESGNTGQNLLDDSQPIYALVSNNFTDREVAEILKPLTANGDELHFNQIKKNYKYQQQLKEILNHKLINFEKVKCSYANKKFALVCHIVDQLVEPVFFDSDIDIYKKGLNISFSNAIYTYGVNFWDKDLFNMFLKYFQFLIREPSDEKIENFYNSTIDLVESVCEKDKIFLEPILESKKQIKEILLHQTKYAIDLSLPAFSSLCGLWGDQIKNKFDAVHDDSKQIEFWKEYIEFYSSHSKISPIKVGYDYRRMKYPMAIKSLTLVNSKSSKQIQFSDLISSSLSYCIKKRLVDNEINDNFANAIFNSKISKIKSHMIMPTNKLLPEELGTENDNGINPLDYLATIAINHQKDYEAIMKKIRRQ